MRYEGNMAFGLRLFRNWMTWPDNADRGIFVTRLSLASHRPSAIMDRMNDPDPSHAPAAGELHDMLEEGRRLLRSLGQKTLAREFWQQGQAASSREALREMLLECLGRCRRH
jgi:hypothetical protein